MDTQVIENNGSTVAYKGYNGTTTPFVPDVKMLCSLISKNYRTPKKLLSLHIPVCKGVRLTTILKVMVIITDQPGITLHHITSTYNVFGDGAKQIIKHLLEIGFIRLVGKPRFIIPFQKYKIEKGYKITLQGETVLNKLLNY